MYEYDRWVVLFDLENCLIRHWDNPEIINTDEIRGLLNEVWEHEYTYTYGIYSYALWRQENYDIVVNDLVPQLERKLGIEFDDDYIFNTSEIIDDFKQKRCPIDYAAYCSAIDKQSSLMTFQKNNPKFYQTSIILVDPTVTHGMNIFTPGDNTMIFINSNYMEGFLANHN